MSVAGHGPRGGGGHDYFPTPAWCVHRLLEAWMPPDGALLEPAAGDGAIIRAAESVIGKREWLTVELREDARPYGSAQHWTADFLTWEPDDGLPAGVSAVITNGPFSLAEEFVRRAATLYPDAELVFLVRLGFLASEKRMALWRDLGVPDVLVLPNRPSFSSDGGTDSSDYAWLRFPADQVRQAGEWRVLASTPADERGRRARGGRR